MSHNLYFRFALFLLVNFLALFIGSWLMDKGPQSVWYVSLNKAPWSPPGYLFGIAWSTIMICFAFYMTKLSFQFPYLNPTLLLLYSIQWVLNVSWNYTFFNQHLIIVGLIILILLWGLLFFIAFTFHKRLGYYTFLILPYVIWMTVAVSLNAYVTFNN